MNVLDDVFGQRGEFFGLAQSRGIGGLGGEGVAHLLRQQSQHGRFERSRGKGHNADAEPGKFAAVNRQWHRGDVIALEMQIPVKLVERVPNPTWVGRENTDNPFILADLFLFKIQRPTTRGRILRHHPYANVENLFTKDEAKERCRGWHQAGIDWERKHPDAESERHIASTKRRMRELERL